MPDAIWLRAYEIRGTVDSETSMGWCSLEAVITTNMWTPSVLPRHHLMVCSGSKQTWASLKPSSLTISVPWCIRLLPDLFQWIPGEQGSWWCIRISLDLFQWILGRQVLRRVWFITLLGMFQWILGRQVLEHGWEWCVRSLLDTFQWTLSKQVLDDQRLFEQ